MHITMTSPAEHYHGVRRADRSPCAACKYQRRKCSPCCLMAPYFPSHKHKEFVNVHRLFGIHNFIKVLEKIESHDREDAVKSMIYESNIRALNPTGGCLSVISDLEKQIHACRLELDLVLKRLAVCKAELIPDYSPFEPSPETNQECLDAEMVKLLYHNLSIEDQSSGLVTNYRTPEIGSIETRQQFLNDNPVVSMS